MMDSICEALENINVLPDFVLNDLDYIVKCYVNNITELDFSCVEDNAYSQEQIVLNEYTYNQMFVILRKKLEARGQTIDTVLLHSYLEYYFDFLK